MGFRLPRSRDPSTFGPASGRGRGRGGSGRGQPQSSTSHSPEVSRSIPGPGPVMASPEASSSRPTHFIALPIGHHAVLRDSISAFTTALLGSHPPIPGLDQSIIVAPRRLHLTLGVMTLSTAGTRERTTNTVSAALKLLQSLQPRITELLEGHQLRVALNRMDIMKPERNDPSRAHVLWVGPLLEGDEARRLKNICDVIHRTFIDEGLMIDERRPLKLHCTIVNTLYRKPRARGARVPFSYLALLASTAFQTRVGQLSLSAAPHDHKGPQTVNLGVWDVNEVQVCEMGSYSPAGEYVSCGGIRL